MSFPTLLEPAGQPLPKRPSRPLPVAQFGRSFAFFAAASQVFEAQVRFGGVRLSVDELPIVFLAGVVLLSGSIRRLPRLVLTFALVEFAASGLFNLANFNVGAVAGSAASVAVLAVCYGAVAQVGGVGSGHGLILLASAWVKCSVMSAVVILMQVSGVLPMVALVDGSVKYHLRPNGLHNDPNFAAYTLVIACLFSYKLGHRSPLLYALLLSSLVATESRMGLLLVVVGGGVIVYSTVDKHTVVRRAAALFGLALTGLLLGVLLQPQFVTDAPVIARSVNAYNELSDLDFSELQSLRGMQSESATERVILAYSALNIWLDNPVVGVGSGAILDEMQQRVGVRKMGHNGYVDRLALNGIGGLFYLVFVSNFIFLRYRSWRISSNARTSFMLAWCVVTALALFLLNVSLWPIIAASVSLGNGRFRDSGQWRSMPPATPRRSSLKKWGLM